MKPHDLPREELLRQANRVIIEMGDLAEVHFKYTCEQCGERVTLSEPNVLYEEGECYKCGHKTPITKGGYLLVMRLS
jgi:DNA-directed RNA polymerase subunit RPC12/RpoP